MQQTRDENAVLLALAQQEIKEKEIKARSLEEELEKKNREFQERQEKINEQAEQINQEVQELGIDEQLPIFNHDFTYEEEDIKSDSSSETNSSSSASSEETIINSSNNSSFLEKIKPYLIIGGIILFSLLTILFLAKKIYDSFNND